MLAVTYEPSSKSVKSDKCVMMPPVAETAIEKPLSGPKNMDRTAHDLRSSLNVIIGYSELMLDGMLGRMTEEQNEGIRDILTSSRHMLELVNGLSVQREKSLR